MKKIAFQVRVPEERQIAVRKVAKRDGVSVNTVVNAALEHFIAAGLGVKMKIQLVVPPQERSGAMECVRESESSPATGGGRMAGPAVE